MGSEMREALQQLEDGWRMASADVGGLGAEARAKYACAEELAAVLKAHPEQQATWTREALAAAMLAKYLDERGEALTGRREAQNELAREKRCNHAICDEFEKFKAERDTAVADCNKLRQDLWDARERALAEREKVDYWHGHYHRVVSGERALTAERDTARAQLAAVREAVHQVAYSWRMESADAGGTSAVGRAKYQCAGDLESALKALEEDGLISPRD